ncbi:HPP family protein [Stackebrandtia endophytica]|uniref:HPP family protein n=1 Tax=Stackebrandtia endophytica TaxID=1496996 RepID=A0A543AWV8_9ACTN|nr:HPP family protein [Stackebrandtia endophytica]TQL77065.1 HPP family protein [Stackebrandtia endophytica]
MTTPSIRVRPRVIAALTRAAAATALLLPLAVITATTGMELLALPFAATAGIIALSPDAPAARPRAILLAHLLAAVAGLAVTGWLGPSVWAAVSAAVVIFMPMLLLRAVHPPAIATAALIGLTDPPVWFLISPVVTASLLLIAVGWLVGKVADGHDYPLDWR